MESCLKIGKKLRVNEIMPEELKQNRQLKAWIEQEFKSRVVISPYKKIPAKKWYGREVFVNNRLCFVFEWQPDKNQFYIPFYIVEFPEAIDKTKKILSRSKALDAKFGFTSGVRLAVVWGVEETHLDDLKKAIKYIVSFFEGF